MGKNIIITESQLNDLLSKIVNFVTNSGGNISDIVSSIFGLNLQSKFSKNSVVDSDFNSMVQKIIDNFEGGYYNPATMYSSAMGDSGETMYGIDRKHGPESDTGPGKEFWSLIDEDRRKNPSCYKLYYDPSEGKGRCYNPTLAKQLKNIIAKMMKPEYDRLSQRYLTQEARDIVNSTPELLFNFTYCVWNGPGYFQKFSRVMNEKVRSGIKDPKQLSKIMLDYRKNFSEYSSFANNLTRRGGRNMEKILYTT